MNGSTTLTTSRLLLWCTGIFCLSLIVFSITLAPSIYWEDSAAFVTAANTLGIPHSPGFPIYVLWGRLFTLLPIDNFAWPVHLMSAFWGSLSLVMVFILTLKLFKKEEVRHPSIDSHLIATAFTLFFGFTLSFWSQTFRAEVYTLNLFFTLCLIWLIVKWGEQVNKSSGDALKYFLAFAFIWGLSACNHSLLVFGLAPAFLIFILLTKFSFILRLRNVLFSLFFGILGFSGYLFLLIRSQQNPALNWARPESWGNLWKVITKSDQLKESLNFSQLNMGENLLQIFNFILSDIFLPVALAAVLGAFVLYKSKPKLLALFTGVLAGNILVVSWAADFSVRNLDLLGYLLPGIFVLTSFATVGVHSLWKIFLEWLNKAEFRTAAKFSPLFATILLLLPLAQLNKNFKSCDKSHHYITYQYGMELLNRAPEGAVIIAAEDNTLLPLWYLTIVEKYRPDVTAVPWDAIENVDYLKTLKQSRPELKIPAKLINHRWVDRFAKLNPSVPVYMQYAELPEGESKLVPEGFFLKYGNRSSLDEFYFTEQLHFLEDFYEDLLNTPGLDLGTRENFGNFFFNWGVFFERLGMFDNSYLNFTRALDIDPTNDRYYTAIGKGFLKSGKIEEAEKFFLAAIELNPYSDENRELLSQCEKARNVGDRQ